MNVATNDVFSQFPGELCQNVLVPFDARMHGAKEILKRPVRFLCISISISVAPWKGFVALQEPETLDRVEAYRISSDKTPGFFNFQNTYLILCGGVGLIRRNTVFFT